MSLRLSWVKALFPKGLRNCTAKSFFSLSAIPSPNPIGHGAALKQPCTNYWLIKWLLSNYINISVFKTSEHRSHSTRWLSWLRNTVGRGLAVKRDRLREGETSSGCRSPPVALQEIYTWDNTQRIDTDACRWYYALSILLHLTDAI